MLASYLVGIGLFVALGVGWAVVLAAWRRSFPDAAPTVHHIIMKYNKVKF